VVVVAAHPVKNAAEDNLVPYGSGAILNEVDGNLTLSKVDGGLVRLHWHGKLRGLEFAPLPFRIETACSPDVLDVKGREVALPVMLPSTEHSAEDREKAEHDVSRKLLRAMIERPDAGQRAWAAEIGAKSHSTVNKRLHALKREKLVTTRVGSIRKLRRLWAPQVLERRSPSRLSRCGVHGPTGRRELFRGLVLRETEDDGGGS
jgi:hypothetical protein